MLSKNTLVIAALVAGSIVISRPSHAQFGSIMGHIQDAVEKKVDDAADKAINPQDSTQNNTQTSQATNNTAAASGPVTSPQTITAYQNYDFKPGEQIIFEDHFTDDEDGEFPAHWDLENGQGVVNKVNGEPAFLLTEGNYVLVSPRMTSKSYLTDPFTVEFDYFQTRGGYGPVIRFKDQKDDNHDIHFGKSVSGDFGRSLEGSDVANDENYYDKWHHAAFIYKKGQMKFYVDNVRALVVPRVDYVPAALEFGGIGSNENPMTFRNVRIASGGSANTIGTLLTNGKFVTHGITFDIGKATLRPESMGVMNEVANFLKENSSVSMEIDGHTDSDGDAAKNLTLSQERADAVKTQLVAMGIDATRLTTKGFGAAKPIGPNDTPEGKANNRRVEFVKAK